MKRMLINATHADEIRVAIADGQKLYDLDIDSAGHYRKKGNIYKARITRIEPSLEACFVNYGSERHGFLPYKEINPFYCKQSPKGQGRLPINKALNEGDEIIVQVNKEERGNKGAALSTYISLAGRYLVYMPNNSRAGGISRQIHGEQRSQLQDILKRLNIPEADGIIIRTAGLGRSFEELQWDFNYLQQVWEAIEKTYDQQNAPFFIYQESDLFIRALRDYLQPSIGEILIDDRQAYEKAREFMQQVMPHNLKKLSYYNDTTPLFSRYQIERQIQSAFEREVKLPSGGSLVIDHTEALLSIDINSARATKGADVETTALNTNLEAADEIARQLRIRDLGGLVVIDFIDMRLHKNQRQVENRLRDAVEIDRARVQVGRISKFGLLEMSRQRLRSSIADSSQITCPTCAGYGAIRSMESLIISIIRLTEEEMIKPKTGRVIIQVPAEISNKILNEKRTELSDMEKRHNVMLNVISNENLSAPNFHVQRLNISESSIDIDSIKLVEPSDCQKPLDLDPPTPQKEHAALQMIKPNVQAPKRSIKLLVTSWFKSLFTSKDEPKKRTGRQSSSRSKYDRNKKYANDSKHKPDDQKQNGQKQVSQQQPKQQQPQQQQPQQQQPQQQQPKQQQPKQQRTRQQRPKQQPQQQSSQQTVDQKQTATKSSDINDSQTNNAKNQKPKEASITATRMTRPLGSVADLVAKKEPIVPSGAQIKEEKAKQASVQQNKSSQDKPSQDKSAEGKPSQDKPAQAKTSQDKPTEDKPVKAKPVAKKPTNKKPASDKTPQNKAVDDKPKDDKSDTKQANKKPAASRKPRQAKAQVEQAQADSKTEPADKP